MGKLCLVRIPARIKDDPDPTEPRVLVKASKVTIVSSYSIAHPTPNVPCTAINHAASAVIPLSTDARVISMLFALEIANSPMVLRKSRISFSTRLNVLRRTTRQRRPRSAAAEKCGAREAEAAQRVLVTAKKQHTKIGVRVQALAEKSGPDRT